MAPQTAAQSADLAAHLVSLRSAGSFKARKANEVSIGKGGELFGTMGCVFCHPSGSLGAMGSKYSLAVMTAQLLETHRPSMLLDEEDATAIAAYLTRSTDIAFEGTAPAGDSSKGAVLLDSLHCTGCHRAGGVKRPLRDVECRVVPSVGPRRRRLAFGRICGCRLPSRQRRCLRLRRNWNGGSAWLAISRVRKRRSWTVLARN